MFILPSDIIAILICVGTISDVGTMIKEPSNTCISMSPCH